jgi:hypothetical protein
MTTGFLTAETVPPRPVELLPSPALATATRKLGDKLTDLFNLSEDAAHAFAIAVVDPSAARRAAENPERLAVPGGAIMAVRADVWSRRIIPDPRNPRTGPARRHPASDLIGRDESTRFQPLLEARAATGERAQLIQRVQSPEHLAWAAHQARDYVIANNDWRESIRQQGVMTEVWLAATTFEHLDGTGDVTVPVTAEGSSRVTCVHDLLDLRSSDVPYTRDDRRLRARVRELNEAITIAGTTEEIEGTLAVKARCERIPALLLVGFEAHGGSAPDFGVAVRSLVALRHVDYPKPWGDATENEALADAVVSELERRRLITSGRAAWIAGTLTPREAAVAGFHADPAIRAASIIRLFTESDRGIHQAVRAAITGQSTRKRITTKLLLEVATSLVLRSVPEEDARKRERVRKYLKEAFSGELAKEWDATLRDPDQLAHAALAELATGEGGPASRELAARAAYPLVVNGQLAGDRGSRNNDQPDRRHPGEVIDRMRCSPRGVHQLRRALVDFADGRRIRLVDENGEISRGVEGRELIARDADLRGLFYAAGEGPAPVVSPETPAEVLGNELNGLGSLVLAIETAVRRVESVQADDGSPIVDTLGVDRSDCDAWRDILWGILEKLPLWKQRGIQRRGSPDQDIYDDRPLDDRDDIEEDISTEDDALMLTEST